MAAASDPMPMSNDQNIPSSPPPVTPGAFPTSNGYENETNGEEVAPPPPPHRTSTGSVPTVNQIEGEAEAFKAAGNKFYKAGQADKAIAEYTKGGLS